MLVLPSWSLHTLHFLSIPANIYFPIGKLISKFLNKGKGLITAKIFLKKKNEVGVHTLTRLTMKGSEFSVVGLS